MRKKILIGLAVFAGLVLVFLGYVALLPPDFRIERSATIAAPPEIVFGQVNDFHKWEHWSPWAKLDPQARNTFEGPSAGKGAKFKWSGNDEVGEGQMTILDSVPHEKITIQLAFIKPFEDTSTTEFTFKPNGEQTVVTWSMFGKQKFIGKLICLFMNMDKMLGGNFDQGLASIKKIAEAEAHAEPANESADKPAVEPAQPDPASKPE